MKKRLRTKFHSSIAVLMLGTTTMFGQNLMSNGGFESGFDDWNNLAQGGSTAAYSLATGNDAYEGNNAMRVVVDTLGANAWDVQSIHSPWPSSAGTTYTLTFWAKAAANGQSFKAVQQLGPKYAEKTFSLTTEYALYTWTFTTDTADLEFKFQFPGLGVFFIDNVELPKPGGTAQGGNNMVNNGGFEANFTNWSNISEASLVGNSFSIATGTDARQGNNAMKVVVAQAGANPWDVQSIHSGWESDSGTTYTMTFYARSTVDKAKLKVLQQNNTYSETTVVLSTEYTKYTWTFEAKEDGLMLRFNYPEAGTFFIDDIVIADPSDGSRFMSDTAKVSLTSARQTMVGFGGALTWYSDWVKYGNETTQAAFYKAAFDDLGIDILRLMNNFYPNNYLTSYPKSATTDSLPQDRKQSFTNSIEFAKKAKQYNKNIDILLSSWTPPVELKSNDSLRMGGLKKGAEGFMYGEFARYFEDVLKAYKSAGFEPDYLSIQNEPGYQNSGWETCEWRPTETDKYASYTVAFDSVFNRISKTAAAPKMIGPEVENIGTDSDLDGANTYTSYTSPLKGNAGLAAYAYHLYNFGGSGESTIMSNATSQKLDVVKNGYSDKPNFMTEFGGVDWFSTALMIHQTITKANASAYIHWELAWENNNSTAISLTTSGSFTIKPTYYTLKHFAKYIDKGYTRVDVANNNDMVAVSAFKNPTKQQITMVMINRATNPVDFIANIGKSILASVAYQSVEGQYFTETAGVDQKGNITLPPRSISTVVIDYTDASTAQLTVELEEGWNLFSSNVRPLDSSIAVLFRGVEVLEIKDQEGFWSQAAESNNTATFNTIETAKGYMVNVKKPASLRIIGFETNQKLNVPTGSTSWQLLGCPMTSATEMSKIFGTKGNCVVKDFDGFWINGGSLNSIDTVKPGKAYHFKMR